MIKVLTGQNDYARLEALKRLMADFVSTYGDFGLEQIDAADMDLGRLMEVISSMPFLAEKRMVIVHNLSGNKSLADKIEQFLDAVSETTDLIMVEPKFDKRLTLYKTLKKRTEFIEFNELDERNLAKWLVDQADNRDGELKANDATYLVDRAGINQLALSNELDKLLSFDKTITRTTIDMLVEPLPSSSVFDLLDAAFRGDRKKTIKLYEDQRKQQVEPQAIMGMIAWQMHVLAVVKFNEKDSPESIAKNAKLNPYVVRKTLNLTRNLSDKQARDLVSRALGLDVRLKSEMIDADDAVQHFLLTI